MSPLHWQKTNEAGLDRYGKFVVHNRFTICVTVKHLKVTIKLCFNNKPWRSILKLNNRE